MVISLLAIVSLLAVADVPNSVRPSVAPWNIDAQHQQWSERKKKPVAPIACEVFWQDEAKLCFRIVTGLKREWVTQKHLSDWGVDLKALKALMIARGKVPVAGQLKSIPIAGMSHAYWAATNVDGWASGVLLDQPLLTSLGAGVLLAAVPAHGLVLVWKGGNAVVDKVVAIGVQELYASRKGAVTPTIYRYSDGEWVPFGVAVKRPPKK